MGNMIGCLAKKTMDIPQVEIRVKSNCCNTHKLVFQIHKSNVKDLLTDSIKRYAINHITEDI